MLALYLSVLDTQEEKDKFEQIYLEYKQIMYIVAYSVLKNKEDTEDAVHYALLKIAEGFSKVENTPVKDLKPYIVMVSRNTAIDMLRSNKRRHEKSFYMEPNDIPDISSFENTDYSTLYLAIKGLPKIYMDVLYLYEIMGFSVKDIAKQLNISTPLAYKRLERARARLKEILVKGEEYAGK